MDDRDSPQQTISGAVESRQRAPIPTTGPHPIPGGEYDRDGFLYRYHAGGYASSLRFSHIRLDLASMLRSYIRRRHGKRALFASDIGLYAHRQDRFREPLAPDILVSLTAGAVGASGTPPKEDRMSYKLWQEPVPDLVLELVSPSSGEYDTGSKPNRYEQIGIPEYWIFDPHRHRVPGGMHGRLLAGGRYHDAVPAAPTDGEMPLPPGTTAYWSNVLGLYLYADGIDVRLHDPSTGRLRLLEEEISARVAAEDARDAEFSARVAAEERLAAAKAATAAAEGAAAEAENALVAEQRARKAPEARGAALAAELERLRCR